MNVPVKTLVFDAYGTLFDPHSVHDACERAFPGSGAALSQAWRTNQLEYTWLRSLMNRYVDFWQITQSALEFSCQSLRLGYTSTQIAQLMQHYLALKPYADVPETLRVLKGKGVPLFILSNGSPSMLQPLVDHAGIAHLFSALLSVEAVKIYKPAPAVYQLAMQATGLEKQAIGFVSSNSWDIAGATSFGFRTFWINRAGQPPARLGFEASATVRNLSDLIPICGPSA